MNYSMNGGSVGQLEHPEHSRDPFAPQFSRVLTALYMWRWAVAHCCCIAQSVAFGFDSLCLSVIKKSLERACFPN